MAEIPAELVVALRDAFSVVVFTGAGVSAESGIPTFRDAMTGLWANYDPAELATPEAFEADPARVTRWYDERRLAIGKCEPNAGHVALVELERWVRGRGRSFTLITQNVDRLHQQAGSVDVLELHGSIWEWRCTRTGEQREYRNLEAFAEYPPRSKAGGLLRPAVVWFGEALPIGVMEQAERLTAEAEIFIAIGTSAAVYPAAGLVDIARFRGGRGGRRGCGQTVEINKEATTVSTNVDWSLRGESGRILPELVRLVQMG